MFNLSRRPIPNSDYWSLFDWFGRSCDQTVGILLSPFVLVLYARAIEASTLRLSWIITGFGVAWILGAAIAPHLHVLTGRVMPWIVGSFIVRTAAIALLSYSASDRSSPADERFRSALICIIAYAAATGLARSAEARHLLPRPAAESPHMRTWLGTLGSSAMTAIAALAIWSVMSGSFTWATVFGRTWTLAAIGLGVATIAAIIRGATTVELPAGSDRRISVQSGRSSRPTIAWALAPGLAVLIMVEAVAVLQIFAEFRRETATIRSSIAFILIGWVAASLVMQLAGNRLSIATRLQSSIAATSVALVISLSLNEFASTSWIPDSVAGITTVDLAMYLFGFLIGVAACWRRNAMSPITRSMRLSARTALLFGMIAACVPTGFIWLTESLGREQIIVIGLAVSLMVLIGAGFIRTTDTRATSRQNLMAGQFATLTRQ